MVGLVLASIIAFWQLYDNTSFRCFLPTPSHFNETVSGGIMAIDNILADCSSACVRQIVGQDSYENRKRMPYIYNRNCILQQFLSHYPGD